MTILVTGAAGFIGYHVAAALADRGEAVLGVDNLNAYYDVGLKQARLARLARLASFSFEKCDISDRDAVAALIKAHPHIRVIVHLAAQAGVRYSLENPHAYIQTNVQGQLALLEAARGLGSLEHFVYASSSSVYGGNDKLPFAVGDRIDAPVSIYAATKIMDELMGSVYAHLYGLPQTGLRFFTVYGPWGRPDMAYYIFAEKIMAGAPIRIFNHGEMKRDFTYIDDITAGVLAAIDRPPQGDKPHQVYNLGNHRAVSLLAFIEAIEAALGREAIREYAEMQPGDVVETYADIEAARRDLGFAPRVGIETGIPKFVDWFKAYHAH